MWSAQDGDDICRNEEPVIEMITATTATTVSSARTTLRKYRSDEQPFGTGYWCWNFVV